MVEQKVFEDAKSNIAVYTLPTGWLDTEKGELYREVEIREITGEEEDMIASKNLTASQRMNNLMTSCTNRIGHYTDKEKIRTIINELVSNDRFFLIYKIREVSLGPLFKFQAPCPHCRDNQLRVVDLSEVGIPALKDPMKRVYEGNLPRSGAHYRWKVQDGKTEDSAQRFLKKGGDDIFSIVLVQRLQEIDHRPVNLEVVKRLPVMDRNFLRNEFVSIEGELDDQIIVDCPVCDQSFNVEADIGKKEFFFPTVF